MTGKIKISSTSQKRNPSTCLKRNLSTCLKRNQSTCLKRNPSTCLKRNPSTCLKGTAKRGISGNLKGEFLKRGKQPSRWASAHHAREVSGEMAVSLLDGSYSIGVMGDLRSLWHLITSGKVYVRNGVHEKVTLHIVRERNLLSGGSSGANGVLLLGATPELMHGTSLVTFLETTRRPPGGGGASQGLLVQEVAMTEPEEPVAEVAARLATLAAREEAVTKREEAVTARELAHCQSAADATVQLLREALGDHPEAKDELQRSTTEVARIQHLNGSRRGCNGDGGALA